MAETDKMSKEALNKMRADDAVRSLSDRREVEMGVLKEEIERMQAQLLRLERRQRKRD